MATYFDEYLKSCCVARQGAQHFSHPRKFILLVITGIASIFLGGQVRAAELRQPLNTDTAATYLPFVTRANGESGKVSGSGPLAISPLDGSVWVANPDSGSISVLDAASLEKTAEIPVGQTPWSVAMAVDGRRVFVLDRAAGTLVVIDGLAKRVQASLPVGPEPASLALTPSGSRAYISLTTSDQVAVFDTASLEQIAAIPVAARPFAVAISDDGDNEDLDERVYVTHQQAFPRAGGEEGRDDSRQGRVTIIDPAANAVSGQITLLPDEHGFPSLLMGITILGSRAWLPYERAAPDLPRGLTTTLFAAVSTLDLEKAREYAAAYLPLNDQVIFGSPVNNPLAAIPDPDGQRLYIVLAGSNLVEVVDISTPDQPRLVTFLPVGMNPRGMALSPDGRRGYVMNYLGRSITVLDLESLKQVSEIKVSAELLPPEILQGKILFNYAADPRLSQGSWMSCASCHPDGGTDGLTWMFPDGPRQTPPLWNASHTLPWHWSAALDEAQDVEETLQLIQHGVGLAPGADPALLGTPNGGRSSALDALAAFLDAGIPVPALASPAGDVSRGRELFQSAGCATCHGGPNWTNSALPGPAGTLDPDGNGMMDGVLLDVGSLNPRDVRGETGFDPPSLLNVNLTAPYLHDGSMPNLEALLASGHPDPQENGNALNASEITDLALFLGSIDIHTQPVEAAPQEQ